MTAKPVLTPEQREHFLNHGWIKIPKAFTKEQAAQMTKNVWTRLGMEPHDKSTWHTIRTNMPSHQTFDAAHFAPRAWAAICELCGGEERISPTSREWRDSLIVNLGSPTYENQPDPPQALTGWHVDGDFFVHYLDSPEQALLVVPLFTDIPPQGGGTALYPAGMRAVAAHLHAHPEGVSPRMVPRGEPGFTEGYRNLDWFNGISGQGADEDYVEASGDVGDVYLLHPLMLHSSTNNSLRNVRIITNPPVSLREPFRLDRSGEEEEGQYSLVERATLRMLGQEDGLEGWKITHEREGVIPERLKIQEKMKQEELKRLEEAERNKTATVSTAAIAA
ncbi:hypothetical protein M406DRAFT_58906 [Cryphonectria parasitica EP155]|uniref:Uncharacterized protein n=1 Tax=Cryphonectria parasitica (strain ATCC 38755 / EP155) TaxID=660469 RepID=A0A9P4YA94_CRYP1|nr:uncharacterized protein M406DRAFT_58906 [Cryphonectria parasitica EP155]KAF3769651.1 hypothetical protein M406DRAFT_58906 [Cryphonectria parasitica EP155]